jgi:hypothetical protein
MFFDRSILIATISAYIYLTCAKIMLSFYGSLILRARNVSFMYIVLNIISNMKRLVARYVYILRVGEFKSYPIFYSIRVSIL